MAAPLTKRELGHVHVRRDRPALAKMAPLDDIDVDEWWTEDAVTAVDRVFSIDMPAQRLISKMRRLRTRLAFAEPDLHDAVVNRIDSIRRSHPDLAVFAAYLVPHRREWFDAVTLPLGPRERRYWYLTISEVADLDRVVDRSDLSLAEWIDHSKQPMQLIATLVDALGPDVEQLWIRWLTGDTSLTTKLMKPLLDHATRIETDEMWAAMASRVGSRGTAAVARDAMKRGFTKNPELAARHYVPKLCSDNEFAVSQRPLIEKLIVDHLLVVTDAKADWSEETVAFVEAIQNQTLFGAAPAEGLPAIFASPPWENRVKWKRPVVELEPTLIEPYMAWLDGERVVDIRGSRGSDDRLEDWDELNSRQRSDLLFADDSPEGIEARRPYAARLADGYIFNRHVAWFEESVHGPLLERLRATKQGWEYEKWTIAMPMVSSELAELAVEVYGRRIVGSKFATAWLHRHAEPAARVLIPKVLSKERKGRTANDSALRMLARHDRDAVLSAAASFGDEAAAAIETFLAVDPLQFLPSRMPALPGWINTAELTAPMLDSNGERLPRVAMEHIITMLALSKEEPYAGLELVRHACEPDSLARFAYDVHCQWFGRGRERKTVWACSALDHFGNDSLVPLIDEVLEERPHDEVVRRAMDAFERVGTDAAMRAMFLRAQRITRKVTKRDAMRTLDAMAEAQGMTMDQLGDITIPRFDLDDDRTVHLDFGPRHFVLTFDEELRPMVRTEDGKPRATLPKPNATDDAELAAVAHKRFAKLKKEIKRTATEQRKRFEEAMVVGRRWTADEFVNNFVDHPLMVEMVRRLVWGVWPAGDQQGAYPEVAFRMAEDGSWADVDEREMALPTSDAIVIGLVHPLELGDDLARWRAIFDDYEIGQPFEQLERRHSSGIDESRWHWTGRSLAPVAATEVPYQRVLGLASRGWTDQQIGSDSGFFFRESRDGRLDFECSPRFTLGTPYADQTLDGISMPTEPGDAHPITVSEVVRELEWLTRA